MNSNTLVITFDVMLVALGLGMAYFAPRISGVDSVASDIDREEVSSIRALGLAVVIIGLFLVVMNLL